MQKTPTSQKKETPFDRAKVGFKNYWYPLVQANQITTRPRKIIMLGEPITITRRNGVAYAISDF